MVSCTVHERESSQLGRCSWGEPERADIILPPLWRTGEHDIERLQLIVEQRSYTMPKAPAGMQGATPPLGEKKKRRVQLRLHNYLSWKCTTLKKYAYLPDHK